MSPLPPSPSPTPASTLLFALCAAAPPTTLPGRLQTGTGSVGGVAGRAFVSADGLAVAADGGGGGALALCPESVEERGVGVWLVRGVGVGFGASGDAERVCVLVRGGLANWAVALAYDLDEPDICPPDAAAEGAIAAAGGLAFITLDNVHDDSPGSLRDGAAVALACVGAALVVAGLFAL